MYHVSNEEYLKDLMKYCKWEEVIQFADQLIARNDDAVDKAYYGKAVALHETHNLDEALAAFNEAIKLNPNDPLFYNSKGLLLRDMGKTEEAIANFDLAFKRDPYMTTANINKAHTLQMANRKEEALTIYDAILKKNANLITVMIFKAECLKEMKRSREALAVYDKAIELEPSAPDLLNNKGNILAQENRLSDALDCYNKALYLNPEFAEAYFNIGLLHHDQKKYKEAIISYNQAIDNNLEGAFAHINKGLCYMELKNMSQAEQELDKAMSMDPYSAFAIYNRGIFSAVQGKLHESIILLRKAVKTVPSQLLTDPKIEQALLDLELQYNKIGKTTSNQSNGKDVGIDYGKLAGDLGIRRENYAEVEANIKELKARMDVCEAETSKFLGSIDQYKDLEKTKPELYEYLTSFATLYNEFLAQLPFGNAPANSKSYLNKASLLSRSDLLRLFYIAGGESAADFVNKSISDPPSTKYSGLLATMAALVSKRKQVVDVGATQARVMELILAELKRNNIKLDQIKAYDLKKYTLHSFVIQNALRTHSQVKEEIKTSAKAIAVKDFVLINAYFEDNKASLLGSDEPFESMFDRVYRENLFENQKLLPILKTTDFGMTSNDKDVFHVKILIENKQKAKSGSQFILIGSTCKDVPANQINSPALKWQQVYKSAPFYLSESINYQFHITDRQVPLDYSNTAAIKIEIVKQKPDRSLHTKGSSMYYLVDLVKIGRKAFNIVQQNMLSKKTISVTVEATALISPQTVHSRFF